ncbi:MAG: hypothetical protein JRH20_15230 [Deltaproteobacteria bacterium]|nr:hypothetical protein [Deltaproteobacteria bacterium]
MTYPTCSTLSRPCVHLTLITVALAFANGCSDDTSARKALQPETQAAVDAVFGPISALISGDVEEITNITFTTEGTSTATVTFNDYIDPSSGAALKGEIQMSNTPSGDSTSLTMKGTIVFDDGTEVVFDIVFVLPWDAAEEDFAGPPVSVSGTVTVNGVTYPADEYILFSFQEPDDKDPGQISDPRFVGAAMDGTIVFSAKGEQWGYPNVATAEATGTSEGLRGIACDTAGICIAVGAAGVILRSTDGVHWSTVASGTQTMLRAVAWGEGTWLAVGDNKTFLRSDDKGLHWSAVETSATRNPLGVTYGSAQWVVVGQAGQILTSPDLATWTDVSFTTGAPLQDVATNGQGVWVAVAESDVPLVSHDNAGSWQRSAFSGGQGFTLRGLSVGKGRFVAVGWLATDTPEVVTPVVFSSDGGDEWVQKTLPADFVAQGHGLVGVATDGLGRWSLMGNYGDHLLSTDNGDSWTTVATGKYGGWGGVAFRP